ncbi:hypothetical protein OFN46_31435, partial [Escherichia coli]|nr:hypothetical protein [Escherichia coli]
FPTSFYWGLGSLKSPFSISFPLEDILFPDKESNFLCNFISRHASTAVTLHSPLTVHAILQNWRYI